MTYHQEHIVPIVWGGPHAAGNTGTAVGGGYPAYINLVFPKDVEVGDKVHVYYSGYALASGQTPGFNFAKMSLGYNTLTLTSSHDTAFDTAQTVDGDTDFSTNITSMVTGKATLTLIQEVVDYIKTGKSIGITHYNTSSAGWIYCYGMTVVLERTQ